MIAVKPPTIRWTREQFYWLNDSGLLDGRKVELLDGEIIDVPLPGARHNLVIEALAALFRTHVGSGAYVREEKALSLRRGELGPDIAIVDGKPQDYGIDHPTTARLVIEVAMDGSEYESTTKAEMYAEAGVAEYVIVDDRAKKLVVGRSPNSGGYSEREVLTLEDSVRLHGIDIPVANIFEP